MENSKKIQKLIINKKFSAAGISRSATIVIAYLMYMNKLNFEEAFQLVKTNRPIICPNNGFIKQLKKFEKDIKDNNNEDNDKKCTIS